MMKILIVIGFISVMGIDMAAARDAEAILEGKARAIVAAIRDAPTTGSYTLRAFSGDSITTRTVGPVASNEAGTATLTLERLPFAATEFLVTVIEEPGGRLVRSEQVQTKDVLGDSDLKLLARLQIALPDVENLGRIFRQAIVEEANAKHEAQRIREQDQIVDVRTEQ